MTIRSKLLFSYLSLLLAVVAIGVAAFWAAGRWRQSAAELSRTYNQGLAAERLRADIYRQIAAGTDFLRGDRQAEQEFWDIQERVTAHLQQLKASAKAPEEIDHLGALEETQKELAYFAGEIFDAPMQTARNPKSDPGEKLDDIGEEVTSDVAALNQYYQVREKESLAAASRSGNLTAYLVGGAALLAFVELLAMVFLLQRWLAGPIAEVGRVTARISRGDFGARVARESTDEWGELSGAVNRMAESLKSYEHRLRAQERLAALGEVAAFAAHNIRNPLAGIRAASQVMLAECVEERTAVEAREALTGIMQSVDRLDVWIGRLLNFAKPLALQPEKADLRLVVAETLRLLNPALKEKKVKITTRVPEDLPPVFADPALLEQVLSSIITNAAEATAGDGSVEIQAVAASGEVSVKVSDTGKGMTPAFLERVFKPFVTDKPGGTGLGLAQAKKIVDLHGGDITIQSRPGAGTTVTVHLPVWREGT